MMDRKLSKSLTTPSFRLLVLLPLVCGWASNTLAQTSPPIVQTFSNQLMGNHTRILFAELGPDGIIYAASMDSSEVIAFDGANWFRIGLPTRAAAIQAGRNGKIWVAQDDGVGYIQRNELGQFEYHAFEAEIDEVNRLPFWDSTRTENGVRFASNNMILDLDETTDPPTQTSYLTRKDETFLNLVGEVMVANVSESKIFVVNGEDRTELEGCPGADQFDLVIPAEESPYVYVRDLWRKLSIRKNGKWESFSTEFDRLNDGQEFRWVLPMSDNRIGCAGKAGFFCLDQNGQLLYRVKISDQENLGNIYTWKEFSDNRIGLACENGFAVLTPAKERREWPLFKHENVGVYDLVCKGGIISICSESGFFEIDTSTLNATNVNRPTPFSPHVCFEMLEEENEFLVSTSNGVLKKQDGKLETIIDGTITDVIRFDETHLIVADVADVLHVFRFENGAYKEINTFPTGRDQAYFSIQDDVVWQSEFRGVVSAFTFYDGLEKDTTAVNWTSDVEFDFAEVHGYLGEDFTVLTDNGILVSNLVSTSDFGAGSSLQKDKPKKTIKLERSKRFDQLTETISNNYVFAIVECGANMLALVGERNVTLHPLVDGVFQAAVVAEWELYPSGALGCWDDKNQLFWQVEHGKLVALDIGKLQKTPLSPPSIVASTSDSLVDDLNVLVHRGSIKISFGVPLGDHLLENVEYQHRLKGLKDDWTDWSKTSEIEYQGMPGGSFEFETRARTFLGETTSSRLAIKVEYPWFMSWPAIACWICMFGLTIYGATAWRSRSLIVANRTMERLVAERTDEIEQKKVEIQRNATLLDEKERRSESERLKSLDTLVSGVAHDFNNLLMVISANNEMIKYSDSDNQDIEKLADDNVVAIQAAADLCREMTDYSGSLPMELVSTSLNKVVQESKELIENSTRKHAEVTYDLVSEDDATSILVDPRILKRALINLVINAKECCEKKIVVQTSLDTISDLELLNSRYIGEPPSAGNYCCLTVSDDGMGIQPGQMERLFDPFFSTKKLGRGLGLAIVMRIVGRFNGVIFVESKPQGGALFKLCFPAMSWRSGQDQMVKPSKTKFGHGLKLLLVDDEKQVLKCTEWVLTECKHHVTALSDAEQALKMMLEGNSNIRPFDCAVLDVVMPGMSGPEMAEIILDQFPEMPIVLVSGYNNSNIGIRILESPNVVFLTKPFRLKQINQAIHDAISNGSSASRAV